MLLPLRSPVVVGARPPECICFTPNVFNRPMDRLWFSRREAEPQSRVRTRAAEETHMEGTRVGYVTARLPRRLVFCGQYLRRPLRGRLKPRLKGADGAAAERRPREGGHPGPSQPARHGVRKAAERGAAPQRAHGRAPGGGGPKPAPGLVHGGNRRRRRLLVALLHGVRRPWAPRAPPERPRARGCWGKRGARPRD